MKSLKFLVPGLALAAFSMPAMAQQGANTPPRKLTSVEGITEYELSNGLHVLLFPDQSKPTITVNITYKVGSRMEGYGETGMAHLLEHMAFKGSPRHTNVPKELNNHGADFNGTTYYDRTNYYETFSASDSNLNWALDLESDRMVNSFIADKDLRSEFSVVRNEFEIGENRPSSILMERILSSAYLWHNYGKSTIGSKDDIEKVPIQNLQAFYKKYYQPDNAYLLVAGKIDEAQTLDLIQKYFGGIPRPTRVLDQTYTIEPTQDGERMVELRRTGDVQDFGAAYHIPAGSHPDFAALAILDEIMTNDPNGRLYQSIVKGGAATSLSSYLAGLHDPGFWYLEATVPKDKSLDAVRKTFDSTIAALATKPVMKADIDKARSKILKIFNRSFRNSAEVGIEMSEFIGQGDWRLAFLFRDAIQKVTPDDVNRVARQYLVPSNRTVGIFIPTSNAIRAVIPPTPNVAAIVKDYKGKEALAQAEAFDASPTNIQNRTVTGTMLNGGKYALLQKTTRGNSVEVSITLRLGDDYNLRNKAALADLTADMVRKGTQNKTLTQLNTALDNIGSTVNISGQGQTVNISVNSTKENLPAALDLVYEMLHRPSFPAEEFKTLKEENISGLEESRSEPQAIAIWEMRRMVSPYPKGSVNYQGTLDETIAEYKGATLDDVKKFYSDFYNGSSSTVAVVGDFDQEKTKEQLNKILGSWAAIKSYTRIPAPFKELPAQTREFKTPDKTSAIYVSTTNFKMRDDNPDYVPLMVADYILGGGALNSRFADRIRQKDGMAYAVGSQMTASSQDETGVFLSYVMYNPENNQKVQTAWREELVRAQKDGLTQEELDAAKKGLLESRKTDRANDAGIAGRLSQNLYLGRTMAFSQSIDDAIQNVTLAQVNAAMRKYIVAERISVITAGDFK